MRASKPTDQAVIFVSNSNAQTEDALRVANKLEPELHVYLILLNASDVSAGVLGELQQIQRIRVVSIATGFPEQIDKVYQILALRRRLARYSHQFRQLVLVLGDDVCPVERSAIAFAKERGIPSLLIQDGILDDPESWMKWFSGRRQKQNLVTKLIRRLLRFGNLLPPPTLFGTAGCNYLAVWGEYTRSTMLKCGVPSKSIVVTGAPRFDRLFSLTADQIRVRHNTRSKHQLLFASQLLSNLDLGSYEADCRVMKSLDAFVRSNPSWDVVVRPHPSENLEEYHRLFRLMGLVHLRLEPGVPLYVALSNCDLLLTYFSTVAVEAMILDKPIVCLRVYGMSTPAYITEGAVLVIDDLSEFDHWADRLLNDSQTKGRFAQARQAFITKYLGYIDGAASMRVARLIKVCFS
jgi:hypothetical protein